MAGTCDAYRSVLPTSIEGFHQKNVEKLFLQNVNVLATTLVLVLLISSGQSNLLFLVHKGWKMRTQLQVAGKFHAYDTQYLTPRMSLLYYIEILLLLANCRSSHNARPPSDPSARTSSKSIRNLQVISVMHRVDCSVVSTAPILSTIFTQKLLLTFFCLLEFWRFPLST